MKAFYLLFVVIASFIKINLWEIYYYNIIEWLSSMRVFVAGKNWNYINYDKFEKRIWEEIISLMQFFETI